MKTEKAKAQLRIMLSGPAAMYMVHSPAIKRVLDELDAKDRRVAELTDALNQMINAHKAVIRAGYERITECGGDCDSPEKMISGNPDIRMAEIILKSEVELNN